MYTKFRYYSKRRKKYIYKNYKNWKKAIKSSRALIKRGLRLQCRTIQGNWKNLYY